MLCQSFGDCYTDDEANIITSIEFDNSEITTNNYRRSSGHPSYLAAGDRGGRIVIFKAEEIDTDKDKDRDGYRDYDNGAISNPSSPISPIRKSLNNNNNNNGNITNTKNNNKDSKGDKDNDNDSKREDIYSWTPFCQFQSHKSEFDYLKSLEIEEKINQIRFCRPVGNNFFLLSCNDKTIKLWKIGHGRDQYLPTAQESLSCDGRLTLPVRHTDERSGHNNFNATPKRVYQNAHSYHINSIALNSDGETFVSADDLSIHWWNYEYSEQCFNIVDMKPPNMEELTEVITAVRFHPIHCNIMMYSSSRGTIKVADTRKAALCDKYAKVFEEPEDPSTKSFFSEIIASISDINFSSDGRYIISRDYLTVKVWDINMDKGPITTIPVHNHLRSILCDLYETDSIFDKFEAVFSPHNNNILTGSYSNEFAVFSKEGTKIKNIELLTSGDDKVELKEIKLGQAYKGMKNVKPDQKILHCAWHPSSNTVAVAAQAGLFLYQT